MLDQIFVGQAIYKNIGVGVKLYFVSFIYSAWVSLIQSQSVLDKNEGKYYVRRCIGNMGKRIVRNLKEMA